MNICRNIYRRMQAKKIMTDWANEVFADTDINISDEELTAMANALAADYLKVCK